MQTSEDLYQNLVGKLLDKLLEVLEYDFNVSLEANMTNIIKKKPRKNTDQEAFLKIRLSKLIYVMPYLSTYMNYNSTRVLEFEYRNWYGYTKDSIYRFTSAVTTLSGRKNLSNSEFKDLARLIDISRVSNSNYYIIDKVFISIVLINALSLHDVNQMLARLALDQINMYLSKEGDEFKAKIMANK